MCNHAQIDGSQCGTAFYKTIAAQIGERDMAGPKRLSPRVVKAIFQSEESAPATAKLYKVSTNLVYLIRGRRIHKATTIGLKSPQITRRERPEQRPVPR